MSARALPDADVRQAIINDIDVNMVVEAAAGTGKTTCLVGRLLTLFRRGALSGHARLAAVTFTHKAAAELRERLDRELTALLAAPASLLPGEIDNLKAAAAALPECHIGTIHSFCARMLRERPVEAGINPDFRELDDEQDQLLRGEAWQQLATAMAAGEHRHLVETFAIYGLDQAQLAEGFVTYAEYPDVGEWIGRDAHSNPDAGAFIAGLENFVRALPLFGKQFQQADPGNDELMPALHIVCRRLSRQEDKISLGQAYRLACLFKETPKLIQKQWLPLGLDKKAVKELEETYAALYSTAIAPFRQACLAVVYKATMEAFALAERIYDRLRREQGVLNFQDLLLSAAAMLERYPAVRADLAGRYARLLIDEVQDTDPVQARIMFLLAGENADSQDWRQAVPRPGSLFIVGDPKQSIYRFRRADIVVYQEMKERIRAAGGKVVGLSSNFRSHPSIVDWVNQTYGPDADGLDAPSAWTAASGRFTATESHYGPAYIPLEPALPRTEQCFSGVYALETIKANKKTGIANSDIRRDEAARIAAFIRHAVDTGLALPQRDNSTRPAVPGDFLIITYKKASSAIYADALRRLGLPCLVSSGGTLKDSPVLAVLLQHVQAMAEPDNPILCCAVLRNSLFGIADTELYRWKQAGGTFLFTAPVPDESVSPVAKALHRLAQHHSWFQRYQPVRALAMVVDDLGLWAQSCLGDDPGTSAGAVATALDLLARESIATTGELAERLAWLLDNHEEDTLPAGRVQTNAVRIMNLHKTKGLEAPVVFLTSTRSVKKHPPLSAIRRDGDSVVGGLVIRTGEYKEKLLAQPPGWEPMAEEEGYFLAAEKTRLNYVAATRAQAALVVSLHFSKGAWQSRFLPDCSSPSCIPDKLPEPGPIAPRLPDTTGKSFDPTQPDALEQARRSRVQTLLKPSYGTVRAKPEHDWRSGWGGGALPPEQAAALGDILHRVLAAPAPESFSPAMVEVLLLEYELPTAWAEQIIAMAATVWQSALWQRASRATQLLREAPYTLMRVVDGMETLERGVIDLVFRETDGWVIVDYKTDQVDPSVCDEAALRHSEQLANYARAWQAITGESVVETGVFFIRPGRYVALSSKS